MRKLNRLWHPWAGEKVEYFTLGDVWECYDEWSVYGAGVPITLNTGNETLVQYYVPYLSALQIFTNTPPPPHTLRYPFLPFQTNFDAFKCLNFLFMLRLC